MTTCSSSYVLMPLVYRKTQRLFKVFAGLNKHLHAGLAPSLDGLSTAAICLDSPIPGCRSPWTGADAYNGG